MFWIGHADLLLSCYCLAAVIGGLRADLPHGRIDSQTNRGQIESYLMLAAEGSAIPPARASDGTKSGADEGPGAKVSPSTAAPVKPSSPSSPPIKAPMTKAPPPAGVGNAALPSGVATDKPVPPPAKAPSLIQRLEGREGDAMIGLGIAVVFFLLGWIGGNIQARRRERSRRTSLRF